MATINIYEGIPKKQSVVKPVQKGSRPASKVVSTTPATAPKKKKTGISKIGTKAAAFTRNTVKKISPLILK